MSFMLGDVCSVPLILSVVIGGIIFYNWFKRPCSNFPPGPRGFPILGCIPFLGLRPEVKFLEYAKTYGNIISVRIGIKEWVVLNDAEAIYEGLVKHGTYSSNRTNAPYQEKCSDYSGILTLNFDGNYKTQKHFGVTTLREFGGGKKSLEKRMINEVNYLTETIRAKKENPSFIKKELAMAICNNIAAVVFGTRFEYDDPMFQEINRIIAITLTDPETVRTFMMLTLSPMLEHIPPFRGHLQKILREIKTELKLFKQLVDEHRETFDKNNLRDFTDAFILKMENNEPGFTELQLLQFIRELFLAGTETSTSTILWGILCLLHYPETEKKIYEEILQTVGTEGNVYYSCKDEMHYTSAFIEELTRFRTIAPVGFPHSTSSDLKLGKYFLPKGTAILPNLWGAHNSPKYWDEPEKFFPERHINNKGEFVKSRNVIPFSVGPRTCIGEQLARMEIFIYFVSLVQKFHFEPDPNQNSLPEINKYYAGIATTPYLFKVVAKER